MYKRIRSKVNVLIYYSFCILTRTLLGPLHLALVAP